MSQHDYTIANQGFPATRADINNALSAIATNNSGTSAPSTQYAGQFWIDTTSSTWTLYIHDGTDDIQFATIDTSANTVNFIDSALASDVVINTSGDITTTGAFTSVGIDDNATSTAITIDSSENVGIGTASPTQKLDIDTGFLNFSNNYGIDWGTNNSIRGTAGSNFINFRTNGSERMRIDSSGHAIIPAGVTLGTAAGTYNAANTLDDYEEGTWTPTYTTTGTDFTSVTYAFQIGRYTKIGDICHVEGRISTNAMTIGSASGSVVIGGLPFNCEGSESAFNLNYAKSFSGDEPLSGLSRASNSQFFLYYRTAVNGDTSSLQASDMGTGGSDNMTYFSGVYKVA